MTTIVSPQISDSTIPRPDDHQSSMWTEKYGAKHRWQRIQDFPRGIAAPKKVRIYQRAEHFILQWWDPAAKRNLSVRVDGDLVTAITRTRQIEERLEHFRSGGQTRRRLAHDDVVTAYCADLTRRANAGDLDPRSVARYESALQHYQDFVKPNNITSRFPWASQVDRTFALEFWAYLQGLQVSPNGHPNTRLRRMTAPGYVADVVRGMLRWAADPDRGNLLPEGFRNPFVGQKRRSNESAPDLFGEPDISIPMAAEFLKSCDEFQLPLFSLLVLYGLRAAEPCYVFHEQFDRDWLIVGSDAELEYFVKGRRDKRLPLVEPVSSLLNAMQPVRSKGLLIVRRAVISGSERASWLHASRGELRTEFERRCRGQKLQSASIRHQIRDELLHEAGGLNYDHIEGEFHRVARSLKWPRTATLKDLRHLFATSLENAGMPEFYRRYLMGHSPGRTAVINYTHLNELRQRYLESLLRQFQPLQQAISERGRELGLDVRISE